MPLTSFSVRMDPELKRKFDRYCKQFGMTTSTAINIFARAVVRHKKIPFDISVGEDFDASDYRDESIDEILSDL